MINNNTKENNMLVYKVNKNNVSNFLNKYPEIKKSMLGYINKTNMLKDYCSWLNWKENNEDKLGGVAEFVQSETFGSKTFYKHDWNGVSGWAEIFQVLYQGGK